MLERGKNERGVIEMVDTESLVPAEHLLRQVDAAVDFERLYEIVEPLYSEMCGVDFYVCGLTDLLLQCVKLWRREELSQRDFKAIA